MIYSGTGSTFDDALSQALLEATLKNEESFFTWKLFKTFGLAKINKNEGTPLFTSSITVYIEV